MMLNNKPVYIENPTAEPYDLPIPQKFSLSVKEAAAYFNIGITKIRKLGEANLDSFGVLSGNRVLIIRERFEEFLRNSQEI